MSFASLDNEEAEDFVRSFAKARQLTLLVGAGASMEASLPSWPTLITRLLEHVAREIPALRTKDQRQQWIQRTLDRDDLLGAGAVVEVMAKESLDALIPPALFGEGGAGAYEPGPIAQEVARLRRTSGADVEILTTNYDDLLERALQGAGFTKSSIRTYVQSRTQRPTGAVAVTHLHGVAARDQPPRSIVLTEEQYHKMQRGSSWQERLVTSRLESSSCIFVGLSLADPNLVRYLYGYKQRSGIHHAAIFVRQADLLALDTSVRSAREEAVRRRWARCGVACVFVDHYADAAQLLYEVGLCRGVSDRYEAVGHRVSRAIRRIENQIFRAADSQADFARRQIHLSELLRGVLESLLETAGLDSLDDERLAVALWLLSADGKSLTGWAHSDRAHQDPRTVSPVPLDAASDWVAVRAVCQGTRVDRDRDNYASRWRFVRALPIVLEAPSRLPIGCVTLSSTRPGSQSVLNRLPAGTRAAFHDALQTVVAELFGLALTTQLDVNPQT